MKRFTLFLLAAVLVLSMVPAVSAAEYTPIDLGDYTASCSGNGWSYDADTATLTLDGYKLSNGEGYWYWAAFDEAPENFTIYLASGSVNVFPLVSGVGVIRGDGSLAMDMCYSSLDLDITEFSCNYYYGDELVVRGGNVSVGHTKATEHITVYDGNVTIEDMDVYAFQILGGNVTAGEIHNCNGTTIESARCEVTGGRLTVNGSTEYYPMSLVFYTNEEPGFVEKLAPHLDKIGTITDAEGNPLEFRYLGGDGNEFVDGDFYCQAVLVDADGNPPSQVIIVPKGSFIDVEEDEYYYDSVLWAKAQGITAGYGREATFCPDLACTRAQVVTFLWRAAGSPAPASGENPFTDVPGDTWYSDAVLWAVEEGITNGYGSETTFCPDETCTRAQVVTFLHRYEGTEAPQSAENPFVDVPAGEWYHDAVLWAAEQQITAGYGDSTTFCPDLVCTRGQIVTFLYRAMQ
ncbi:MAG: S-layer homology domain-containing protein [Oscillospiraceae bacterium]|nr:S-layer homology domain-containing protein [Oscillospiraceae bacterium]